MSRLRLSVSRLAQWIHPPADIHFRYEKAVEPKDGVRAHQVLVNLLNAAPEQKVSGSFGNERLLISGRVDAIEEDVSPVRLTEIKSSRSDLRRLHDYAQRTHWAQLYFYAHLWLQNRADDCVELRLLYYHLDHKTTFIVERQVGRATLAQFFADAAAEALARVDALRQWRELRNQKLIAATFPFAEFRPGQRRMATAVFRSLRERQGLVVDAPTGSGKSLGSLFPALHALAKGYGQRLIYLSARTTGQNAALQAVEQLGLKEHLRIVQVLAKEKVCLTEGMPCTPELCRYAKGYQDRAQLALQHMHNERLSADVAGPLHEVCPFELSLQAARLADLVICDYNYVLDPLIRSASVIAEDAKESVVLLDEAHQLIDRGRAMFSAELSRDDLLGLLPRGRHSALRRLVKDIDENIASAAIVAARSDEALIELSAEFETQIAKWYNLLQGLYNDLPESDLLDNRARHGGMRLHAWVSLYAIHSQPVCYLRVGEARAWRLTRLCLDATGAIERQLSSFRSVVGFSATVKQAPPLGIPNAPAPLELPSPFHADQLLSLILTDIGVRYHQRARSLASLARFLLAACAARRGNYLVFLPSYQYLNELKEVLQLQVDDAAHVGNTRRGLADPANLAQQLELLSQTPDMTEQQRDDFLDFLRVTKHTRLALAVTGGMFGESIDLGHARLSGIMIVGLGLPPPSLTRDAIATQGGSYAAYEWPALVRVLQSAGRLLRKESDRGILLLIDERFQQARWRYGLPPLWQLRPVSQAQALAAITAFWHRHRADDGKVHTPTDEPFTVQTSSQIN